MAMPENRAALADLNGQWIDRFHDRNGLKFIVLDIDSSVSTRHKTTWQPASQRSPANFKPSRRGTTLKTGKNRGAL
jgi:hypothetical protein